MKTVKKSPEPVLLLLEHQESEIPNNYYFTDNFSDIVVSQELWPVELTKE